MLSSSFSLTKPESVAIIASIMTHRARRRYRRRQLCPIILVMTNPFHSKYLSFARTKWFLFVGGLLLGALTILTVRFVTYQPVSVHYHANFALYLNGQREAFKGQQYYQEVTTCSSTGGIAVPQQRAHMHDNANGLVHVEDHVVTWGQFFENLGWYVGP